MFENFSCLWNKSWKILIWKFYLRNLTIILVLFLLLLFLHNHYYVIFIVISIDWNVLLFWTYPRTSRQRRQELPRLLAQEWQYPLKFIISFIFSFLFIFILSILFLFSFIIITDFYGWNQLQQRQVPCWGHPRCHQINNLK